MMKEFPLWKEATVGGWYVCVCACVWGVCVRACVCVGVRARAHAVSVHA